MIALCIILIAILTFLRAKRRVTEQRRYPTTQHHHHLTTYSPEQLRQARNDRHITTW
jgi:hypothetical protein